MTEVAADLTLDCTGLACPMPILKLSKALAQSQPGQVIQLIATDRGSKDDVPAFCQRTNNALLGTREEEGRFIYFIKKGV